MTRCAPGVDDVRIGSHIAWRIAHLLPAA